MGGPFSGRRRRRARTPTVGQSHTIDDDDLTDLVDRVGVATVYEWRDEYGEGEPVTSVRLATPGRDDPLCNGGTDVGPETSREATDGRPSYLHLSYPRPATRRRQNTPTRSAWSTRPATSAGSDRGSAARATGAGSASGRSTDHRTGACSPAGSVTDSATSPVASSGRLSTRRSSGTSIQLIDEYWLQCCIDTSLPSILEPETCPSRFCQWQLEALVCQVAYPYGLSTQMWSKRVGLRDYGASDSSALGSRIVLTVDLLAD